MSARTMRLLVFLIVLLAIGAIALAVLNQNTAGQAAQINSWLTANPPP